MNLLEFFESKNPEKHSELERAAINAFAKLNDAESWRSESPHWGTFINVISIGILDFLMPDHIAKRKLREVSQSIIEGMPKNVDTWAELMAGGLISNIGCSIRFVPEIQGHRTPDLIVTSVNGDSADVEVVRAQRRVSHSDLEGFLQALNAAIGVNDDRNYGIYLGESPEQYLGEIIDAIAAIDNGSRLERPGKWAVVADEPQYRAPYTGGDAERQIKPSWWADGPSFRVVSTRLGGEHSPVTSLSAKIPLADYLNPIRRKAERPQRSAAIPYVIALESTQLPDAARRIPHQLSGFFPLWSHVSAVLVFVGLFGVNSYTWKCSLIRNPTASNPINMECFSRIGEYMQEISADIK